MKKILAILFSLLAMLFVLTACGSEATNITNNTNETNQSNSTNEKNQTESADNQAQPGIKIESCRFVEEVRAIDGECATTSYPPKNGKLYIDTVIFVLNNATEMTEDDFMGYVTYDDLRYDFQYCVESYTSVSVSDDSISAMSGGRVHLFTSVPAEAANGDKLTAYITVDGKEYSCEVEAQDNSDALTKKKELKKGDKESLLGGLVEFEVVDCKYTKYLQATDYANSKQYTGTKPFVDCIIKVTNNTQETITDIFGYVKIGDEIARADTKIETENNTELEFLSGIESGKTEYVHIFVGVDESVNKSDRIIRFNFGGNCYYCKTN